jgi:hypothetical protein
MVDFLNQFVYLCLLCGIMSADILLQELNELQKDRALKQVPSILDYTGYVVCKSTPINITANFATVVFPFSLCWTIFRLLRIQKVH